MSTKPTVISLYTGAGGLDYGFEAAGFRTSVAVEMNRDACITLRHNRPRMAVIEDDIHNVTSDKILSDANLVRGQHGMFQIDLIAAKYRFGFGTGPLYGRFQLLFV